MPHHVANMNRFKLLWSLSPLEAVRAWLEGDFGFGDEPALLETIRRDPRIKLTDAAIIAAIMDAMDDGISAELCLERLAADL